MSALSWRKAVTSPLEQNNRSTRLKYVLQHVLIYNIFCIQRNVKT